MKIQGPIALRAAALAAVLLLSGYAVMRLAQRFTDGPGPSETVAPLTPPPGADDPSNRGIFIEGELRAAGTMQKRMPFASAHARQPTREGVG